MWAKFYDYQYFSANFLSIDASKSVSMIGKRSFYMKEEFSPRFFQCLYVESRNPWDMNAVAIFRRAQPALVLIMFSYQHL